MPKEPGSNPNRGNIIFMLTSSSLSFDDIFFFKFQTTKVFLDHIESRKSHKAGAIFDVLIQFVCSRQKVTSLMNAIRQNPSVEEVTVIGDKDADIQGHLALVLITVVPSVVVECQFS